MNVILTEKQKIILEIAKEKGFVTLNDVKAIYSTNQIQQLKRLIELGCLQEDYTKFGHFVLKEYG